MTPAATTPVARVLAAALDPAGGHRPAVQVSGHCTPADIDRLAEHVDAHPGISDHDLFGSPWWHHWETAPHEHLTDTGYRLLPTDPASDPPAQWNCWPSRVRCAELARTATGERREQLLRGAWL